MGDAGDGWILQSYYTVKYRQDVSKLKASCLISTFWNFASPEDLSVSSRVFLPYGTVQVPYGTVRYGLVREGPAAGTNLMV